METSDNIIVLRGLLSELLPEKDALSAEIAPIGGMSNCNYLISFPDSSFVLRVPGKGSEGMIFRDNERYNSIIAYQLGLCPEVRLLDPDTGIKITDYIKDSESLSADTIQDSENRGKVASVLRHLHYSSKQLKNEFNIFGEIDHYQSLLDKTHAVMYPGWEGFKSKVMDIKTRLDRIGVSIVPCHNDPVPENFLKNHNGSVFLIDWEYSGMNDPVADIAALFLESNFSSDNRYLFLTEYYSEDSIPLWINEKILSYQILWDCLWAQWTVIKESNGYDFGRYGRDRFERAVYNLTQLS
ncbi:MAG: phosphotransferase [Bacteroidales bacterium]|nr:phosphotransferase [Bacteroidales bacterium]